MEERVKQEPVCKTEHTPPCYFVSHCDLDLYPIEPKINREHLLSMAKVCMKFEKAGPYQTLVIDRARLYTMDRQTSAKQYTPSSSKGGIKEELPLSQITNFKLFQTDRVCRRQFQI